MRSTNRSIFCKFQQCPKFTRSTRILDKTRFSANAVEDHRLSVSPRSLVFILFMSIQVVLLAPLFSMSYDRRLLRGLKELETTPLNKESLTSLPDFTSCIIRYGRSTFSRIMLSKILYPTSQHPHRPVGRDSFNKHDC
jgi:hypothetical protein